MTVYVVQVPERRNPVSGVIEPLFDLSPAQEFGQVEVLLSPTTKPFSPAGVIEELYEKLANYNGQEDFILCTGNPILIGMASAVAFDIGEGEVSWLQWSRPRKSYIPVKANFLVETNS